MPFRPPSRRASARLSLVAVAAALLPVVAPAAPAAATAPPAPLYLSSDNGGYAADALLDPTAATTFRAPAGSRLVPEAPIGSRSSTAIYADGQLPGNVATPTFSVPRSSTVVTGVCVDLWLSKAGGLSETSISLTLAFQVPGAGGGPVRSSMARAPYQQGSVVNLKAYYVMESPVPLARGVSVFLSTVIDNDQGLTIHYGSATHPSSITVNADPATCSPPGSPPAEPGGMITRFTAETAPDVTMGDDAGEPTVAVDWATGAVQMTASERTLRVAPGPSGEVWSDVSAPVTGAYTRDPFITTDHVTGRTWMTNLTTDCTHLAFTDDVGTSWVENPRGCGPLSTVDHQSLASGPYEAGGDLPLNPRALYICGNEVVGGACARSIDGGVTFGPGRLMYTIAQCNGSHGQIRVGPTGVLAVPVRDCGSANAVAVSRDGGASFTLRPLPGSVSEKESDPALAFDADGVLYAVYVDDAASGSVLRFSKSADGGATWSAPRDIGAAFGIKNVQFPVVTAGDNGRVSVVFLGSHTAGDDQQPAFPGVWHTYVALTTNGGAHWTVSNPAPLNIVQRGCINLGGLTASSCRNLLDFIGVDVDREGSVVAVVADGCDEACEDGVGLSDGARLTLLRQRSGPRLFQQARTTLPGQVFAKAVGRDTAVDVTWAAPADNGSAITGYRVFRSLTRDLATAVEVASLGAGARSYRDTDVRAGLTYYYSVAARNAVGAGRRLYASEAIPFVTDAVDATKGAVAASATAVADGADPLPVTVTVRDVNGNPVADHPVRLVADGATASPASARTDVDGRAAFTVRTTRAGGHALRAYTDGTGEQVAPAGSATFVPGTVDATRSVSTKSRPKAPADGATPIEVGVRLLDANDNPVEGVEVGVRVPGSSGAVVATATTDATGWAAVPVTSEDVADVTVQPYVVALNRDVAAPQQLTFAALPEPPAGVTAIPGEHAVLVEWTAAQGATPATSYVVYRDGQAVGWVDAGTRAFTDTGLTNWTTYAYEVASFATFVGESARSAPVPAMPEPRPSVPQGLAAHPGDGLVSLTWGRPADGNVAGYQVYVDGAYTASVTGTSHTVTGLPNNVTRTFAVSAYNSVGEGVRTAGVTATPKPPPSVPGSVAVASGDTTLRVTWTVPTGTPPTHYRVYRDGVQAGEVGAGQLSFDDPGRVNGTTYGYQVSAYSTTYGESARSVTVDGTAYGAPGVPAGVTAVPGDGAVTVSWQPVAPTGPAPVTGYKVYVGSAALPAVTTAGTSATVTGLANGTTYAFTVSAYNAGAESARGAAASATPNPPPNVPTGLAVASGDTALRLTWTAPATGTPPTHYKVYRDGVQVASVAAPATTFTDTGLANGTTYAYRVSSWSSTYGESGLTVAVNGTPYGPPGVPTGVTAAPGNTTTTVSWSAVAPTAAAPVTGYRVYVNGSGTPAATTTGTSATVTGLTNGTAYGFQVTAYNAGAESARSGSVSATPNPPPNLPTGVAVASGDTTLRVTWTAPGSGTAPTHYRVYRDGVLAGTVAAPATTYDDTGLANGTTYSYRVSAYSTTYGESALSAAATGTPYGAPAVPTGVTATGGNNAVTVSWPAVTGTTARPVTGYRVYVNGAGTPSATTAGTSATVGGLTNGTTYSFTVSAYNAGAESARSTAVSATPLPPPDLPTGVAVAAGDASARVTWTPPAAGTAPTHFRVYRDGVQVAQVAAGTTSFTDSGLTNGTTYAYRVSSWAGGYGESGLTAAVNATPYGPPAVPTGVSVAPGDGLATVSWTAVAPVAGKPVSGYKVYVDGAAAPAVTTAGTSAVVGGLTNGTSYSFEVTAYNSASESARSAAVAATPKPPPGVPTGVTTASGNTQVQVGWTPPSSGTAPTHYRVYRDGVQVAQVAVPASTATVTGLTNGTTYAFRVSSYSTTYGESALSAAVNGTPYGAPGVPTGVAAVPGNAAATVSWNAVAPTTAAPVTGYRVYVNGSGTPSATTAGTSATVTGLTNGSSHTFQVTAYNAGAESARSASVSATPNPPPDTPAAVTTTPGDTTVRVAWTAPASGTTPTHYRVYRDGAQVGQVPVGTTAYDDTGLTNGTTYTYRVTAYSTTYGESAQSAAVSGTPYTVPLAPTGVTVAGDSGQATVSWPAVASTAARPVTGYRVYVDGATTAAATTAGTSATVTGLTNGTTYSFQVTAYNGVGESARSTAATGYAHTRLTGVTANLYNSCGITSAAHAVCWGDAFRGDGAASGHSVTPTTVQTSAGVPLANVVEVGDGANGSCARTTAGWVYCWGGNTNGQLGDGTTTTSYYAKRAGTLTGITDIAVQFDHVCATNGSSVWCWGKNDQSQVDGVTTSTTTHYASPRLLSLTVPAGATVAQLATAEKASCARFSHGEVQCWGVGELMGRNTFETRRAPGKVWAVGSTGSTFLNDAVAITSGSNTQICVLRNTAPTTIACWGYGSYGQLGDGGTSLAYVPRTVVGTSGTGALSGMTTIAAGNFVTCAASGAAAYCWGRNNLGQLGAGSAVASSSVPVQVAGVGGAGTLTGVTSVSVGTNHVCAGTADATVHCWGGNGYGQLGQPVTTTSSSTPLLLSA